MTSKLFERVVIVGPGLIGGSLGKALREGGLAHSVIGVGHRQASLDLALEMGAVDEATLDLDAAVPDADLVVLATSVGMICEQAGVVIPQMKAGAILTDVGSVKRPICDAAATALRDTPQASVRFVGGHPIAGSEQRGIQAARSTLYRGATCILTPTAETCPEALASVRALWESTGCRVLELDPETHDGLLAQISHLPHAIASCLVNAVDDGALPLAASGFMDSTRIASGDPGLWRDIFSVNREALAQALRLFGDELREFSDELEAADSDALLARLNRAKSRRDAALNKE